MTQATKGPCLARPGTSWLWLCLWLWVQKFGAGAGWVCHHAAMEAMEMLLNMPGGCRAKPKREGEPKVTKTGELQGMATLVLLSIAQLCTIRSIDTADGRLRCVRDHTVSGKRPNQPGETRSSGGDGRPTRQLCQAVSIIAQRFPVFGPVYCSSYYCLWLRK